MLSPCETKAQERKKNKIRFCCFFSKSLLDLEKKQHFFRVYGEPKKNKNFAPEPKSLLDLGSGANFFLPTVNQKRLRLRGVEGPLYRHASEGILSSLSPPLFSSLFSCLLLLVLLSPLFSLC